MTSTKKVTAEPLTDAEIDHLLANLTSEEYDQLVKVRLEAPIQH